MCLKSKVLGFRSSINVLFLANVILIKKLRDLFFKLSSDQKLHLLFSIFKQQNNSTTIVIILRIDFFSLCEIAMKKNSRYDLDLKFLNQNEILLTKIKKKINSQNLYFVSCRYGFEIWNDKKKLGSIQRSCFKKYECEV